MYLHIDPENNDSSPELCWDEGSTSIHVRVLNKQKTTKDDNNTFTETCFQRTEKRNIVDRNKEGIRYTNVSNVDPHPQVEPHLAMSFASATDGATATRLSMEFCSLGYIPVR